MSRNYDNWERLVAAVVKKQQIWELCHQDSLSTICGSDYSSDLEFCLPVSLGSLHTSDTFQFVRRLPQRRHNSRKTDLGRLLQDVQVSDQRCFGAGTTAVIKLIDSAKITQDELEKHMIVLGDCVHENVATPWGYHFSQMTKLMVYDYYSQGSVFDMFQGYGSRPDWKSRVRIAVGAARGLAHIHAQCGGKLIHGNIRSSNIFVNSKQYGCVSTDFGRSDTLEYYEWEGTRVPASQMSDVYSFGMLLLELVTGRSLVDSRYVVHRLRLSEPDALDFNASCLFADEVDMYDTKLDKFPFVDSGIDARSSSVEQGLRRMLKVAQKCLAELSEDRPTMSQVVLLLQLEKTDQQIHQHPTSHHESPDKKPVWNRFLRLRR